MSIIGITTFDRIQVRAYFLWENAGRTGDATAHWLEAEIAETAVAAPIRKAPATASAARPAPARKLTKADRIARLAALDPNRKVPVRVTVAELEFLIGKLEAGGAPVPGPESRTLGERAFPVR